MFGTVPFQFFQLRSSSALPNTSSSTNSAPQKGGARGQLHVFYRVPQGYSSFWSLVLPHGVVTCEVITHLLSH